MHALACQFASRWVKKADQVNKVWPSFRFNIYTGRQSILNIYIIYIGIPDFHFPPFLLIYMLHNTLTRAATSTLRTVHSASYSTASRRLLASQSNSSFSNRQLNPSVNITASNRLSQISRAMASSTGAWRYL